MGRLFWKFFLVFWLAQLLTSIGVGFAIWASRPPYPDDRPPPPMAWQAPPPAHRLPPRPHWLPPLMPILAGSLVSLIFAALLAGYFARPIRTLREAFNAVAKGQLDIRAGTGMGRGHDELIDLGQDFDRMAEQLQASVESQRRLLHDVSHELRSPLARLQAAADLMRQQPERSTEFVSRIERDIDRMDTLVGELLTLARLDAARPATQGETIELSALVREIAEDARLEAERQQVQIDTTLDETARVTGNPELLRRAVENILRNALRHSPAQGRVTLDVRRNGTHVRIEITDQGTGVAEGELAALFQPFFRGVAAEPFAGFGLGLAIARRVAEVHGGTICAENRAKGGLAVTLELPFG